MEVKKGTVKLISESVNSAYRIVNTYEAIVFEKTDGNYKEVITRKLDSATTLYDVESDAIVDDTHTYEDINYTIHPNMSLDQFYNSLNMENYTISYTETLTVI